MKLSELIEACFNKTNCTILMSNQLSDAHPVLNDLKHGDVLLPLLYCFTYKHCFGSQCKSGGIRTEWSA